jgi:hypothetical protein
MTTTGVPPKAHTDIVRKARDLMAAQRATRDILLDRSEPAPVQLVAQKRKLFDRFRKKPDPFTVTATKFDAWTAEIEAYHPARRDLWRETSDAARGDGQALELPTVAMAAEKWDSH